MTRPGAIVALLAAAFIATSVSAAGAVAEVTYVSGTSIYLGAGSREGLRPGLRLQPENADAGAGLVLEVRESTASRAVCAVREGDAAGIGVGDRFRYDPAVAAGASSGGGEGGGAGDWFRRSGVHGRVGFGYLTTDNGESGGTDFHQPQFSLRLDGDAMFGSPISFHSDIRSRRTTISQSGGRDDSDTDNRVYRLAVGWDRPGQGFRFGLGRQVSPELSNVSVYDGGSFAYDATRWSAGGFVGNQPDGRDYGMSNDVHEYGGFYQYRSAAGTARRWSFVTGAVASYEDSEINREYLFLQGRYTDRRISTFVTQEVDVNREWKEDAGEDSIDPTSTFASLHFRVTDDFRLRAGYDNRRDIRLYRDRVTPQTEFDDDFRRGLWGGGSYDIGRHFRIGADARTYGGDAAGDADSWSADLGVHGLTARNASARLRVTSYENDRLEGWLYALDADLDVGSKVTIGLSGGLRDDEDRVNPTFDDDVTWYGVDLDIFLSRALYFTLWIERSDGDFEEVTQAHATLSFRF